MMDGLARPIGIENEIAVYHPGAQSEVREQPARDLSGSSEPDAVSGKGFGGPWDDSA